VVDKRLAVLLIDEHNVGLAGYLTRFGAAVAGVPVAVVPVQEEDQRRLLGAVGVPVADSTAAAVTSAGGVVTGVRLADATVAGCDAVFVHPPTRLRSDLADKLGCRTLDDGSIEVNDLQQTSVSGVYAAGDIARRPTMPLPGAQVSIAAAEGTTAGVAIDQDLIAEDFGIGG
jgi:thioredoxin reductase